MFNFEPSPSTWRAAPGLLASLVLMACSQIPTNTANSAGEPTARIRDADDIQRIDELERQSSEYRIRLSELQRQMSERRRQYLEERQRFERELKESKDRTDELQKKLDAVLAVDRDLRRGSKISE